MIKKPISFRKKEAIVSLLLFLFYSSAASNNVWGDYSYFGLPFIHLTNPAKISHQNGIPTGIQYTFESAENWNLQAGIAYPVKRNGVSFVYGFTKETDLHLISAGVNQRINELYSLGSAINMHLDYGSRSSLDIDLSIARVKNEFSLSFVFKDIKFTDTNTVTIPSFNFIVSGPVKNFRNTVSYELFVSAAFLKNKFEIPYPGGAFNVRYSLKKYPSIVLSSGFQFFQIENREYQSSFNFSAGINIRQNNSVSGMHAGYMRDVSSSQDIINSSLFFNPYGAEDNVAPNVKLSYQNHPRIGYYFSLYCEDNERGSKIKDWVLIIADEPSAGAKVIKLFSGGSIPPSTIYWDRRDTEGNYNGNTLYARLVAVDRANNESSTEWIELNDF